MTVPKQNSLVSVNFLTTNSSGVTTSNTASASVAYGSPYFIRVDVTNTSPATCQNSNTGAIVFVCPTGSIQLLNGTAPLNDFPIAQNAGVTNVARLNERGFAEDQPIQLAPGSYKLNATYTADANSSFNSSSTSNTVNVTIAQATSTTQVTSNVSSVVSGGSVTLTATVNTNSNGAGVTGTVQFKNGSSNLGAAATCTPTAATASASGFAFCTATLTTALSEFIPLTEHRPGPGIRLVPFGIMCVLFVAFLALQRRLPAGRRFAYAAAGVVFFACVASGIAGCSGNKGATTTGGGANTRSITATYSGDANYSGSTSSATTVTIQ
jgi:hypothetical protein